MQLTLFISMPMIEAIAANCIAFVLVSASFTIYSGPDVCLGASLLTLMILSMRNSDMHVRTFLEQISCDFKHWVFGKDYMLPDCKNGLKHLVEG